MKRWTAFLLGVLLLLSGCSGDKPYVPTGGALGEVAGTQPQGSTEPAGEQELTMVYYPDRTMNPITCTDYTNRALIGLIYQSLFVTDRDYNVHPMLCDHYYVSEDMRTYIFYPAAATFSDGSALTAEDIAASLNAAMESDMYGGRFFHFESIQVSADGGVTIQFITPMDDPFILLDIPIIKKSQLEDDRPLGTGPYVLESTRGGLRLRRRTNWWCQSQDLAVTASSITLIKAETEAQIRDEFEFYDVGLVCADPGTDSYADYSCDYELWDSENGIFLFMACNPESDIFSDQRMRSGLTWAIDRDRLVEEYYRGFARSASLPASPLSPYYNRGLASRYAYDPDRFAQLVAETENQGKTVRMLVNAEDSLRLRVAGAIRDMLTQSGLAVELVECGSSVGLINLLVGRDYDLFLGQTKLSPNMDLSNFFYTYGSLSYGGLDDAEAYVLCKKALENQGNYYDLYRRIMEEGRLCPILFRSYAVYATRGLLTGLDPARDNVFFYTLGTSLEDIRASEPDPTVPAPETEPSTEPTEE